ncbi:MAG: hypothetical protein ABIK62_03620 [candidate division WOR-3 bacterium]
MDELVVTGQILTFDQGPVIFRSLHIRNGQVVELSQSVQSTGHIRREFPAGFIVPAFVDSHVHILELGLLSVFPDLSGVERLEDVFDIIADARELARELKFLVAFNLEPGDLREQRMPLACELDRVLPDTPLMVTHRV